MSEQLKFFDTPKPISNKAKRNFENRFQRWSDKNLQDGTTSNGSCGYGSMCDYCEDMDKGRPCVRALNEMLRTKKLTINYETATPVEVWYGDCFRKVR